MRLKDLAQNRVDLLYFEPEQFVAPEGVNIRQNSPEREEHIQGLMVSIRKIGVQTPVTFYRSGDRLILTDGFSRHEACMRLKAEGWPGLMPARLEPETHTDADRCCDMLTRNGGLPLTMDEKAEGVKRLLAFGWTAERIHEQTGFKPDLIQRLIVLAGAPEAVKAMVRSGEVSPTIAIQTIKKHGKEEAAAVLGEAKAEAEAQGKDKVMPKVMSKVEERRAPNKATVSMPLPAPSQEPRAPRPEGAADYASPLKDEPLSIGVEHGQLVIRFGTAALLKAIQLAPIVQTTQGFKVTDPKAFVESLVKALKTEDEDGATVVYAMFDAAVGLVVDGGDPGWTCD